MFRVPRLYRVVLNEIYYDIWRVLKGFNKRCECVFELVLGLKIGEYWNYNMWYVGQGLYYCRLRLGVGYLVRQE